ncbi:addiction module protein [Blastopirellula sp. JC732]|uniref:Addiction module protein n=1 Tax=Blastopirellula sediminis TaxID=2894196 RepID=A0A9X1MSB0_9BACT|nr:addiction module protein [Blastopirellula sediminis]MCC9604745.1 addiction module protein [Blastopirellula sediminis]MCC9631956.1 addiction module protein [Blastopirellula sediminis]
MITPRDEIAQRAMALPPEDRQFLADMLEQSLPYGEFRTPEIAEAWSKELDRRIAAYDRGETNAVDFEAALANMRQALETHRSSKKTP